MGLSRNIKKFFSAPGSFRWLFIRACFYSALVRLTLTFLPFRRVLAWQGTPGRETPQDSDPASARYRAWVGSAMALVEKYMPWPTECYTLAITAKILLNQRGIPSTIYIGFRKTDQQRYQGHAWLRSFDQVVTGMGQLDTYQVHAYYS